MRTIVSTTKLVIIVVGLLMLLTLWRTFVLMAAPFNPSEENYEDHPLALWSNAATVAKDARHEDKGGELKAARIIPPNKMIHLTVLGLGHRLIRTTAAWHLAQRLGIQRFKFQWGTCGNDHSRGPNIFLYLFGRDDWLIDDNEITEAISMDNLTAAIVHQGWEGKHVLVRNDVYGYLPAQTFQDHRLPLPAKVYHDEANGPFQSKLASDIDLYKRLRDRFFFVHHVQEFMDHHAFQDHTVIGLHLRAGNGEGTHFSSAGRHIANETEFVDNLIGLIHRLIAKEQQARHWTKPPLVFLATDTAYLVPQVSNLTQGFGVRTVVLPQLRVEDHQGVTFSAWNGEGNKCLQGWQAMVSDMILLSHADILIAARHSSFTQSMPISLVFDQKQHIQGPHFCEASSNATTMTCLQDFSTWLFRDDLTKTWIISLAGEPDSPDQEVHHKALIHLPDVVLPKEYPDVVKFLKWQESPPSRENLPTHTYGNKRFNPKYRKRKPSSTPGWNFTVTRDGKAIMSPISRVDGNGLETMKPQ